MCIDLNIQRNGTNSAAAAAVAADKRGLVRVLDQTTFFFLLFLLNSIFGYNKNRRRGERGRSGPVAKGSLPEPSIIGGNRVAAIVSLQHNTDRPRDRGTDRATDSVTTRRRRPITKGEINAGRVA